MKIIQSFSIFSNFNCDMIVKEEEDKKEEEEQNE